MHLLAVIALSAFLQTSGTTVTPKSVQWDYADSDLSAGAVTKFNLCFDTTCTDVPLSSKVSSSNGTSTYQASIPALVQGQHMAKVAACNASVCSDYTSPLAFTLVIKPGTPANLRIGG